MKRVWTQCIKELVQIRRDRLTLALAFLLPLMTLLIFGFAIRLEQDNIPLAVQDFDRSPLSRSYIARLYATNQFVPVNQAPEIGDRQMMNSGPEHLLDQGKARAVVIIPPDFSEQIKEKKTATVQALVDGTDVNNARVTQNSIKATTSFFLETLGSGANRSGMARIVARTRLWFNPGRREALHIVPGVFALVLSVFPALLTAVATVREKEKGTIVQAYASSLTATEFLLGKWSAYLLLSLAMAVVTIGTGCILFQMHFVGDPSAFLLGTPLFLASTVGFGVMIGARSQEQNSAVQAVALAMFLTSFLLSGFIYPLSNIPFPLSLISNIVPARYYIVLTRDVFVRGTGWSGVWFIFPILFLITLAEFSVARRILGRMQVSD